MHSSVSGTLLHVHMQVEGYAPDMGFIAILYWVQTAIQIEQKNINRTLTLPHA